MYSFGWPRARMSWTRPFSAQRKTHIEVPSWSYGRGRRPCCATAWPTNPGTGLLPRTCSSPSGAGSTVSLQRRPQSASAASFAPVTGASAEHGGRETCRRSLVRLVTCLRSVLRSLPILCAAKGQVSGLDGPKETGKSEPEKPRTRCPIPVCVMM